MILNLNFQLVASRQFSHHGVTFTAACPHPINDSVFCGTNNGGILAWDMRSKEDCLFQEGVHGGSISALCMHPSVRGATLSGATDGTIVATDFTSELPDATIQQNAGLRFPSERVLIEPAEISSIDIHTESRTMLAGTIIGGVWRRNFYMRQHQKYL